MVSIAALNSATTDQLVQGLSADDGARVLAALDHASQAYSGRTTGHGQDALEFAIGVASTLAILRTDAETRIAALMFELTLLDADTAPSIEPRYGKLLRDIFVDRVELAMRLFAKPFVDRGEIEEHVAVFSARMTINAIGLKLMEEKVLFDERPLGPDVIAYADYVVEAMREHLVRNRLR